VQDTLTVSSGSRMVRSGHTTPHPGGDGGEGATPAETQQRPGPVGGPSGPAAAPAGSPPVLRPLFLRTLLFTLGPILDRV
jgi:hypothetical protein